MKLTLKIWRQDKPGDRGGFVPYAMDDVLEDMSFLELLDILNEDLIVKGKTPVAFDHDCREGICGSCGFVIDGQAHGPLRLTTTCQLFMRHFRPGQAVTVEPFRSRAFPVIKDLVVNRNALDRIIQAGGFISARTGSAPDGNAILVSKQDSDRSMDAAACIGCGACVAACPNASAMLFTGAKMTHLGKLPQGKPERNQRAMRMVSTMQNLGFGACTNHRECEAVCPKGITIDNIAFLNRDYVLGSLREKMEPVKMV